MDLPEQHAVVLERIGAAVRADDRFVGLAVGGSARTGGMDVFSDLDLILIAGDEHHAAVMAGMRELAASWGTLLTGFTGEHVGEPRLLICLYDDPLLHVDLKFLRLDELARRTENPIVVWERGSAVTEAISGPVAAQPALDVQWIEDRFWVWVHYAATKLGRGELFEVVDVLAFLRAQVLGPLEAVRRGQAPRGVRRLEQRAPEFAAALARTVTAYGARECLEALEMCVELYRGLRPGDVAMRTDAERASVRYLADVGAVIKGER